MPSGNWSFPCSPRNPAKVREELRLLASLVPVWQERGLRWSPQSGTQLEFGRQLRSTGVASGMRPSILEERRMDVGHGPWDSGPDANAPLGFQRQTTALSDDNLRWTARARFGTYKFFGFAATDLEGFARLTPAGQQFAFGARPGDLLLRQLLKWQYPDNQHRGRRWAASDFAIFPFVATARLVLELGGLTRQEIGIFCFTMRRTEDAAATAEAIRQFRQRQERTRGRTGKALAAVKFREASRARYEAEGRRVVSGSTNDYADALIRYYRFTGMFSVRGPRLVVASGRESELEELVYRRVGAAHGNSPVQLALGEPPPVQLAEPWPLFADYDNTTAFYAHFGDAETPPLPWENPERLTSLARALDANLANLRARELHLRAGRTALSGPTLPPELPESSDALLRLVDGLRRERFRLENAILALESRTPERLEEALNFYRAIMAREVIDPPTFLEWNTWRVFLSLDHAREIVPHLALDDDLQPLSPALGNQPDLEVDFGTFLLVVEVTLRTGADQRQAETRPVTRHVLEAQRRYNDPLQGRPTRPVYGLFLTPRIHPDTANDFFVALKYRVIERQQIVAVPLSLRQFTMAMRPFASGETFVPQKLQRLFATCVEAALAVETGDDWMEAIDAALRRWLAWLGAPEAPLTETTRPMPLPLLL
jgi:hypothetical protein